MKKSLLVFIGLLLGVLSIEAQTGNIRGKVFEQSTGEPVMFATVLLEGTTKGTNTNAEGFFNLSDVPVGDYRVLATFIGYDTASVDIQLKKEEIEFVNLYMEESGISLTQIDITGAKAQARSEVQVSKVTVTPRQIKSLPSIGGQPDIAQYLPVLPGVIFTGDQGGQLYIRGGAPVQNLVLLDGMTIYNPFHSIGFFSVFETETVRTIDVYTGGFNAEYGGRASAVIDIKMREGNRRRFSGIASVNPFQAKAVLEGPIVKLKEDGGGSLSFMLAGKTSLIHETSKVLYPYAVDTALYSLGVDNPEPIKPEEVGLPYKFTDLYGKLSYVGGDGSKFNLFGFDFTDQLNYPSLDLDWSAYGGGMNFTIVPPASKSIIGGLIAFSDYELSLFEANETLPRRSRINNFTAGFDFTFFGDESEIKYGINVSGMTTELSFRNFLGLTLEHKVNTTEISGFFKYRKKFGNLVIEPSLRLQVYASLSEFSPEPRLGIKYNVTDKFRLKFAGGLYSQNLISTSRESDVVNLFIGFITDPQETFLDTEGNTVSHRLQKANHAILGAEIDVTEKITLNIEPYYKDFTQLVNLNRNKESELESDYATETGEAYGIDFSGNYKSRKINLSASYSYGFVKRFDGEQTYFPIFDRRHNVNLLGNYGFGDDLQWEVSARWNYGSGFPFRLAEGFYSLYNLAEGISTDIRTENADLGVVFTDDRDSGRLPSYSRFDISLKYTKEFSEFSSLEAVFSVTNVTNRDNIFFAYLVENQRINQLPILPSLGLTFKF